MRRILKGDKHDGHDHKKGKKEEDHGGEFPVVYIIFLCGFWFMLLLDQVIFKKANEDINQESEE